MNTNAVRSAVSSAIRVTTLMPLFAVLLSACGGGGGSGDGTGSTSLNPQSSASEQNDEQSTGDDSSDGGSGSNTPATDPLFTVVAANDLGMHCADLDDQVFSILPPFNVVHAQVIQKGGSGEDPRILTDQEVTLSYAATSSPVDPAGGNSINTTSQNLPGIFKSNFWAPSNQALPVGTAGAGNNYSVGGLAYAPLYPNAATAGALLDPPLDLSGLCDNPATLGGCPSALALFEPNPVDTGLPVPALDRFYPRSGSPVAELAQQRMPGPGNAEQPFMRFDRELPFFTSFDFGARLDNVNWFAADGIPLLPVDDTGLSNPYPLMKVTATANNSGTPLASLDVVLPVASEADCQSCHVEPLDCLDPRLPAAIQSDQCNGSAVSQTSFNVIDIDTAVGDTVEQKLLNAAKINILRLHDAKHGSSYRNWDNSKALVSAPCNADLNPDDPNCLANQTPIQCSRCHYSPALDLLQTGPVDEPEQGIQGRQQTFHVSMSRAMHGHHGALPPFDGKALFPAMPGPVGRDPQSARQILTETCYQCHPGKRTACLRGAMATGGVVCQDCHGDMQQVGNDFTLRVNSSNPGDFVLDGSLRVPWASEPGCQSCHTGDAVTGNHPPGAITAPDGVRLLQAYTTETIHVPGVADPVKVARPIQSPASRFAENQASNAKGDTVNVLYRLSKGHGGVMCEGCHNSTHAIWPNRNPNANDNIAANQLQGHSGTLVECSVCHADGSLGLTLDGPHGMHPVNDSRWNNNHEDFAEHNLQRCTTCHGQQLQGTVLSRMAATRTLACDEGPNCRNERITLARGTQVSCTLCHENPLFGD